MQYVLRRKWVFIDGKNTPGHENVTSWSLLILDTNSDIEIEVDPVTYRLCWRIWWGLMVGFYLSRCNSDLPVQQRDAFLVIAGL